MTALRKLVGPFNRVEGDLEIDLEIRDGVIETARVNSPLYRGFEQILQGKDPRDALVYTPRICGICSVSQSVAAAVALARAQGLQPAENGRLATNLILACENLADHLSHFYLFFMPDFARDDYAEQSWFRDISGRFRAQSGSAMHDVLPARAQFLHLTGILAGKWPHSLSLQPGGSTRAIESQERVRLLSILATFRHFLETVLFADSLEAVVAVSTIEELEQWRESHPRADFARFLAVAAALDLAAAGRASDRFMSYGAYAVSDTDYLFSQGLWQGKTAGLDENLIAEDISHSWLLGDETMAHPYQGQTLPDPDMSSGYSWCKAPRLDGRPVEVGALARQVVNGHPLVRELVADSGGNVRNRVIARLLELALVVPRMERWVRGFELRAPFCRHAELPDEASGAGLVEAARGSLGHWLRIEKGKISNYQIIAPTTWNFSPRDAAEQPGPLEQALQGTVVGDAAHDAVMIQHIVRSFDPCMVCTVH